MPFQIINIPFDPALELFSEAGLNDFLLNKKLISWQAEFFQQSGRSYWSVFLEYESVSKQKEIPKLNLTPEQELLFQKLREWRKEQAEKQGIPVYVIANNQILGEMVTRQPKTLEDLKQIKGFGDKKVTDYGKEILHLITTFNQTS
ncbi:HRDC domain-containing protein [bacterium]|nr:HRDC domain-containing protein [bacterium]